jgi:hypothetical protein
MRHGGILAYHKGYPALSQVGTTHHKGLTLARTTGTYETYSLLHVNLAFAVTGCVYRSEQSFK